ncbi:chloride channel protein [Streptomyces sp. NPDC001852]|uniref:chloride channel protein n=1 Tax=Streptomyces sp. NPDC001852 TaxID=3364619 RepID=UPI0036D1222F
MPKPASASVSTGTGGPFGAEGPIIMTGGAVGSLLAQFLKVTIDERKALLVAGSAAGMPAGARLRRPVRVRRPPVRRPPLPGRRGCRCPRHTYGPVSRTGFGPGERTMAAAEWCSRTRGGP